MLNIRVPRFGYGKEQHKFLADRTLKSKKNTGKLFDWLRRHKNDLKDAIVAEDQHRNRHFVHLESPNSPKKRGEEHTLDSVFTNNPDAKKNLKKYFKTPKKKRRNNLLSYHNTKRNEAIKARKKADLIDNPDEHYLPYKAAVRYGGPVMHTSHDNYPLHLTQGHDMVLGAPVRGDNGVLYHSMHSLFENLRLDYKKNPKKQRKFRRLVDSHTGNLEARLKAGRSPLEQLDAYQAEEMYQYNRQIFEADVAARQQSGISSVDQENPGYNQARSEYEDLLKSSLKAILMNSMAKSVAYANVNLRAIDNKGEVQAKQYRKRLNTLA